MPIDIRLRSLSYSSRLQLHACPRKYQLQRLNSIINDEEDIPSSVTFAFGHVVGLGVQLVLQEVSEESLYMQLFMMWEPDLLQTNDKQKKSFWLALLAIQRFQHIHSNRFLQGYKLVQYKDKPAVELSFIINFPDGFTYKGFVDAVLQHEETGEVMVLEVKTTSALSVASSTYKNSAQAIGYSIVLDALFPSLSSYKVQYLIYKTKSTDFEAMSFEKDYLARALWIREILLDIDIIKMYEQTNIYPMYGESCNDFYRECEYLNLCTLSLDALTEPITEEQQKVVEDRNANDFQIVLTLNDLIESQLGKE